MALVKVFARQSEPRPVGRVHPLGGVESALETLDPAEQLGCHPDLRREHLDEAAMAQPESLGHLADGDSLRDSSERHRDSRVTLERAPQATKQRLLQDPKTTFRYRRLGEAFAKLAGVRSPHRIEDDVPATNLARRRPDERQGAAGF